MMYLIPVVLPFMSHWGNMSTREVKGVVWEYA